MRKLFPLSKRAIPNAATFTDKSKYAVSGMSISHARYVRVHMLHRTRFFNILGKPSAKQDAIGKAKGNQLKVSVTVAPVAGKATDHMVRFLAPHFGVSISDITVVFGRYNINKQLHIQSPQKLPPVIAKALSE